MRAYLAVLKGVIAAEVTYRLSAFAMLIGNFVYLALLRYLWASIYEGRDVIRGLTYEQAFIYTAMASSVAISMTTWVEFWISSRIVRGTIITDLTKPLDFQLLMMARAGGRALSDGMLIVLPSVLAILLFSGAGLGFGIGLVFLPLALLFAFLVSYSIDFMVGLSAFYTTEIWGTSNCKVIFTSMLSGALVPLPLYPEWAQSILKVLPFQAIYHTPMTLMTRDDLQLTDCLGLLGVQLFWLIVLYHAGKLLYRKTVKVITVAGG